MHNAITVILLTYNEELHLARALASLESINARIVIVDSGSSDRTRLIAEEFGADFFVHKFENQARQFQWALDTIEIYTPWVMRLDADEIIESDLAAEINEKLPKLDSDVVGVNLRRKHIFLNRWIRHGGRYPVVMLRLWRKGHARMEDRWMDEHLVVERGRTVTFRGGFSDINLNDIGYFIDKHNKYATREAIEVLIQRYQLIDEREKITMRGTSAQVMIKRFVKGSIYNKIPFYFSALFYFIWRYFFQLGFLDGVPGVIYHFLQGFWYRFLVGAKTVEFDMALRQAESRQEKRQLLESFTGFKL